MLWSGWGPATRGRELRGAEVSVDPIKEREAGETGSKSTRGLLGCGRGLMMHPTGEV